MDQILRDFTMEKNMNSRIDPQSAITLLKEKKCDFIDVRFEYEQDGFSINFAKNIPLNKLPDKLNMLDKNKIIICICPGVNRSILAATYLISKDFNAKFLTGGMVEFMKELRPPLLKEIL